MVVGALPPLHDARIVDVCHFALILSSLTCRRSVQVAHHAFDRQEGGLWFLRPSSHFPPVHIEVTLVFQYT